LGRPLTNPIFTKRFSGSGHHFLLEILLVVQKTISANSPQWTEIQKKHEKLRKLEFFWKIYRWFQLSGFIIAREFSPN